jgi:hypothetical protein
MIAGCVWLLLACYTDADCALERLWADLGTHDPVKAQQTIRALVAGSRQTLPLLKKHLPPVPRADPDRIARCIADLDHDQFAVRRRAARELEALAEQAETALRRALTGRPSLEVRHAIARILEKLKTDRLHPPPDRLRASRAVEVLEDIGDREARQLLAGLAAGAPGTALTVEAQAALERLSASAPTDGR